MIPDYTAALPADWVNHLGEPPSLDQEHGFASDDDSASEAGNPPTRRSRRQWRQHWQRCAETQTQERLEAFLAPAEPAPPAPKRPPPPPARRFDAAFNKGCETMSEALDEDEFMAWHHRMLQEEFERHPPEPKREPPPVRPRRRRRQWGGCYYQLMLWLALILAAGLIQHAVATPLSDGDLWQQWAQQPATGNLATDWLPYGYVAQMARQQGGPEPCPFFGVPGCPLTPSRASCAGAPAGVDGCDVHAPSLQEWQVNTGVTSFLPDGAPVTPAEARYTVDPDTLMPMGNHPLATAQEKQAMQDLCHELKEPAFSYTLNDLPGYQSSPGGFRVKLKVISDQNAFTRPRRQSPLQQEVTEQKCTEMLEAGIIEAAPHSKYASACVVAAKKGPDGLWTDKRFCVDMRLINIITAPVHSYMPVADQLFQEIGESSFFSKIDMRSGFFQLLLEEETKDLTSFWWNGNLMRFTRAPFGLKQLPAIFCGIMLQQLQKAGLMHCTKCYVDDIVVHSKTAADHVRDVKRVLQMLVECGLKAHPEKSLFMTDTVDFLGFDVSRHGLTPAEAKVKAFRELRYPSSLEECMCVMGKLRYYGCFCEHFSSRAEPILRLLKKGAVFNFGEEQRAAMDSIRNEICQEGKALKRYDPKRPVYLHVDFSNVGLGAVLSQTDGAGQEYMVACCSRSLNKHERNYASYKGECLAAVWGCKIYRHFLHGRHFTLITDHEPLKWLMQSTTLEGAHARWACMLQEYDFDIVHRAGTLNANADALSRMPLPSSQDPTGARLDHDATVMSANRLRQDVSTQISLLQAATPGYCAYHGATPEGEPDVLGLWALTSLNTVPQPVSVRRMVNDGVILYEPFGGLCAGLEAVLRSGVRIHRYYYSDTSRPARLVAEYRIQQLLHRYPHQLPLSAVEGWCSLPQDVTSVTSQHLLDAGAGGHTHQWLVIAGPECKDFSPAGENKGWSGKHSYTLLACIRIIGYLQQLQHRQPPLYIVENAAMQHNFRSQAIREEVYPDICNRLGTPVMLDAAQFGSYAHRCRNFWQNFTPALALGTSLSTVLRPGGLIAQDILDPGRTCAPVTHADAFPFWPCNTKGEERSALPTLVAYPMSRAFLQERPGSIFDANNAPGGAGPIGYTEPNPDERELALGYTRGSTAAPEVTTAQRHVVTGNCMDQRCLSNLVHHCIITADPRLQQQPFTAPPTHSPAVRTDPVSQGDPTHLAGEVAWLLSCRVSYKLETQEGKGQDKPVQGVSPSSAFVGNKKLARFAQVQDTGQRDIHEDQPTLDYLRNGELEASNTRIMTRRILRRAWNYSVVTQPSGQLTVLRRMADGSTRVVPPPGERRGIVEHAHLTSGHFGARRTAHLLLISYWWSGLLKLTQEVVERCEVCDRVKASFNTPAPDLNPLKIEGLFYRWGMDLCGPFPTTSRGNRYVAVMIEHFSKTIVLEPLVCKEAKHTCYAYEHGVLSRYGACAELLTDQGSEFKGEFQACMVRNFIDHRTTSANHPQADGLAERCVQTVKRSIRRFIEDSQALDTWDEHLPYLQLGYNCSRQESTGCSPYHLLYAREPHFPTQALAQQMAPAIGFDALTQAGAELELARRSKLILEMVPLIANRLAVAQQRDKLRYAQMRSGTYLPLVRKFSVGDFVYMRRANQVSTVQVAAQQKIVRVQQVKANGVVVVQGRCGQTQATHVSSLAPCHLPHLDGTVDPSLAVPPPDMPCEVCNFPDDEQFMLMCDFCNLGWHMYCLDPPLSKLPPAKEPWLCPSCLAGGVTYGHLKDLVGTRAHSRTAAPPAETSENLFSAKDLPADKHATTQDGKLVRRATTIKGGKEIVKWGVVHVNVKDRPMYFTIHYDDGTFDKVDPRGLRNLRPLPKGSVRPEEEAALRR